tara:strand:- start:216 stop:806 length:591 start_codon:yes stop_codon:yes gene_type:complete
MEINKKVIIFTSKKNKKNLKLNLSKYKKLLNLKFIVNEKKLDKCDIFISFVQGKIISKLNVKKFKTAINFHPAPPTLPGRDPHHWAIYYKKKNYGITIHKMTTRVDEGKILFVENFKIKKNDNPQTLRKKSFRLCLNFLKKNFLKIVLGDYKSSNLKWSKIKKKRADVYKLINGIDNFSIKKQITIKKSFDGFLNN